MTRAPKPTASPPLQTRTRVTPQAARLSDAALVSVSGMIDERFPGFGDLSGMKSVVIDLGGVTFMSSFGVRQWLRSMAAVPSGVANLYLLNCPPVIVDQLNMILNFGGRSKLLSLSAPFMCSKCGAETREMIDVLGEHDSLARGEMQQRACKTCGGTLDLDEIAESYFACLRKYGADSVDPLAAQLIANSATLRKAAVEPSIQPATTNAAEVTPAAVMAADTATARGLNVGMLAVLAILLLAAAGAYVLVGPR